MDASVANAPSAPSDPPVIENEALSDETEDYLDAQYNITRMIAMGVGLCIICSAEDEAAVTEALVALGEQPFRVGTCVSGSGKVVYSDEQR